MIKITLISILTFIGICGNSFAATKDFKLSDFAGTWVMHTNTIGGLGSESGPGMASAVTRIVKFDTNGNGSENNGTFVSYLPDGQLGVYTNVEGEAVKLMVTDPANGAGVITFDDNLTWKGHSTYNFLATRSKSGAVNKLQLIFVNVSTALHTFVMSGELTRQSER
ncbi:MAG: hypothetical protein EBY15_08410 [Gammaproteobacteria bacterium]|nr:hypothetical protein [Gammaproteobacteria bacterium]